MSILDRLIQLRGVTWTWNDASTALGKTAGAPDAGVIAQEVERVFPELVLVKDGYRHVNYTALIGVLVEAVKELKADNDSLQARIEALEALARAQPPKDEKKPA
ncbi:MAG: tail fiber domain-containing protein [Deltaproteobacteria bacterium]|nr:tail fiber domain-containing protein [Deltaproteobacteria bacterium]